MDPLLNHRPGEHPDPASQPNELMPSNVSLITADDLYLFNEGSHFHLYDKLGAHATTVQGVEGTYFAVWAPEAEQVSVFGTFNQWDASRHPLRPCQSSGIWEGFIPGVGVGALYKFHIRSRHYGAELIKTDPFARLNEIPPKFASVVWSLDYTWRDHAWIQSRARHNALDAPISIYEVHLGSWMRVPGEGNRSLSYREAAPKLIEYVKRLGFTHVEFLPLMDHPFFGSWGYQTTGYFAPSGNYGTPQDLMYLIDHLHNHGIGVILDWVPSHFPTDAHGLNHSTAHISTNMRIRGRDFSPTGTRLSSITAATKCAAFSSAAPCSGWNSTMSMACAWTPWPPCCIWTTHEKKANGFPTNMADEKIWRPLPF